MTVSLKFQPPVIAHRGASAYAPENTLAAFIKAMQLGIKWVEFDVMQASTGEPVIFHDDTLERTTQGSGALEQYSYAFLQTLDAGIWFHSKFAGERIPSLIQTMDFLRSAGMSANVEIKASLGHEEALVLRIIKEMSAYPANQTSTILYSSFSFDALRILRKHDPHCLIGLLLHEWEPDWQEVCHSLQCVSVHVNQEILTYEKAQEIKRMGKILLSYTVNDPERALELYSFGVDAVFSDAPDRIINAL